MLEATINPERPAWLYGIRQCRGCSAGNTNHAHGDSGRLGAVPGFLQKENSEGVDEYWGSLAQATTTP
jgi:hypothetical protein